MSSFAGRMKEYPTISLDRFDRENLHARAYFLSHCHKDHMKGLKGPMLKRKLKFCRTVKLYCSFVTKELLLSNPKYDFWGDQIAALEQESPTQISLIDEFSGEREDIVVTLLPAGHCPGSVMFLIEGAQGTVLYTGDFRLAEGDASRIELLHSGSRVKDIQSVYLDSTFYDPRFYQIPSREACLNGIRELVSDWISRSVYHVVWLNCKAAYGYEYLFTNLGDEFNTQIHVKSLDMFKKMPEILSHVTTDRATQIHACRHPQSEEFVRGNRLPCGSFAADGTPLRIISIKPSTMWFGERSRRTNIVVKTGVSSYRACFSFHSSYSELKDFLSYLQPINIYPSVVPICRTHAEVSELLKPMCRKNTSGTELIYKPLGTLKQTKVDQQTLNLECDDWLFEETDLAPMRKKMMMMQEAEPLRPDSTAPPSPMEEALPLTVPVTHTIMGDYMDCTESNDEEEEEEEGDEETEEKKGIKEEEEEEKGMKEEEEGERGEKKGMKEEEEERGGEREKEKSDCGSGPAPPCWEEFFTTQALTDSQNSQSHSCSCTSPSHSGLTGSQTPELFGEEDDDNDEDDVVEDDDSPHQTPSLSNQASTGRGLSLTDTILIHSEARRCQGDTLTNATSGGEESGSHNSQSEPGNLSESQVSSDFDIPSTPESQTPRPDELTDLYRKLAAGEEVVCRKGSQGSF